jgi:HK97 family phage prohead protease
MVRPTAFENAMAGEPKAFLHHHDKNIRVATTKDNLTLFADGYGLAFKLYIPRTPLGRQTKNFVRNNTKQCMSANFTATEIERHTIDGNEIFVVHKADLHEVSLCESGANTDAFAVLVNDSAEFITDMCKSLRMTDEMNRAHIKRAIRKLESMKS